MQAVSIAIARLEAVRSLSGSVPPKVNFVAAQERLNPYVRQERLNPYVRQKRGTVMNGFLARG